MISKPEEHEINRAGKRLLREVLEPLGWVVNDVQEDYAIDSNVQIFDGKSPTGAWFHVQLKSSASSAYSADQTFISQELLTDHARHYAVEMREPILLIHADTKTNRVYWYAPQLDGLLVEVLGKTGAKFITVRVPTNQHLPSTAPDLLTSLDAIYLTLASRELTSVSAQSFAESIKHFPNQETPHRALQEKTDILTLHKIRDLVRDRKWDEARPRADAILANPDSGIEVKFWARIQLETVDYATTLHSGKPQGELPKVILAHAKALQQLADPGPARLKLFALVARRAAELELLVNKYSQVFMALHQHLEQYGNPMLALGLYAQKSALTKSIAFKYNECVRLARFVTEYPDRWMLGRALPRIVNAIVRYLATLRSEKNFEAETAFSKSAFQICKVAAWISEETGDAQGVLLAILSALMTTQTEDSDAYRWAVELAQRLVDPDIRVEAFDRIERATKRWRGERIEGDYHGDTAWKIIQNMPSALDIDVSDENDPFVRGLRIAAKDNNPERVLARCEHIVVSQGATGPIAQDIWILFNITTASSKVVHFTIFTSKGKIWMRPTLSSSAPTVIPAQIVSLAPTDGATPER